MQIKLNKTNLYQYFSVVDSGHYRNHNSNRPYDFINNNSNVLTVTVGDSWTWGADMTPNDDPEHRLTCAFGSLISNELNSDWLNLAQCGSGNFWLYDRIAELIKIIPNLQYQHIYIICTLTETGRAIDSRLDIDFYSFFKHNRPEDFITYINNICVDKIVTMLASINNVTLRIGTNFVDYVGCDNQYLMPKSWLELMCNYYQFPYTGTCCIVSPWVIEDLRRLEVLVPESKRNEFIDFLNGVLDNALQRERFIKSVPDITLLHPGSTGHKIWADYILQMI